MFDLDDTLYQELDFLKSAYRFISKQLEEVLQVSVYEEMLAKYQRKENAFHWLLQTYASELNGWESGMLIQMYREHIPEINMSEDTRNFLELVRKARIPMGLITDGRAVTQRNKLRALGIENLFCDIIISEEFGSEKPDEKNFRFFAEKYPAREFYYFGDNTIKDFIAPKILGWKTICLRDQGFHIHAQDIHSANAADIIIDNFREVNLVEDFSNI